MTPAGDNGGNGASPRDHRVHGEVLGARYVLDAAKRASGDKLIAANATGSLEVFSTPFPGSSWQLPWIQSLVGNAPAVASGVAAALRARGREDVRVLGQGAASADIGCLSGMFNRNDDVLFVCYENEAYNQGNDLPLLAMAHRIPYVATATVADPHDLEAKVETAMEIRGARYLHVFVPCPIGWGSEPHDTTELARLVKETGLFPVFEACDGDVIAVSKIRRQVPVEEYLILQRRNAHLFGEHGRPDVVARLQAIADRNVSTFGLLEG